MTISPVYSGRPDTLREPVEQRVYELLDALHIPYQRVDHEPAYDMDACAGISEALGITICKNLLLTPRNRSAFYAHIKHKNKNWVKYNINNCTNQSRHHADFCKSLCCDKQIHSKNDQHKNTSENINSRVLNCIRQRCITSSKQTKKLWCKNRK